MVHTKNPFLDSVAHLISETAGLAQGVCREVETVASAQVEKFLKNQNLVTREEFEAVREMALQARRECEKIAVHLERLETMLGQKNGDSRQ
jgi:BMFP domain-containing protein YqiC